MEKEQQQVTSNYFNPNWENSMDQSDPFESGLSSIVSSPAASNNVIPVGGDSFMIRELIGRLGNICNSGDILQQHSANTCCYTSPLNSPAKLMMRNTNLAADPGFAATVSCFGEIDLLMHNSNTWESGKLSSKESMKMKVVAPGSVQMNIHQENNNNSDSTKEESSLSDANGRKRKSISRGKAPCNSSNDAKGVAENEESNTKRSKQQDNNTSKDYIHVRARRGQATDSHSLAERVRREKISERMKFLQDLVPGCNKVTGKAVMLDEIINYVQSLQRQVEFLSMKLATVNPRMDFNMEALLSKHQQHGLYPLDSSSAQTFPIGGGYQPQLQGLLLPNNNNPHTQFTLNASSIPINGYGQIPSMWEDDLQSFVQMGFNQQPQSFQGSAAAAQMKLEL